MSNETQEHLEDDKNAAYYAAMDDGTKIKIDGSLYEVCMDHEGVTCKPCEFDFLEHRVCEKCIEELNDNQYLRKIQNEEPK